MDRSSYEIMRMFQRIKVSTEGPELVDYLESLSLDNYKAFKRSEPAQNEFHKGYAFAIDNIIAILEECDIKANEPKIEVQDWTN